MFLITINGHRIPAASVGVTFRNGDTSLITLEAEALVDNGKILVPWDKAIGFAGGFPLSVGIEGYGLRWTGELDFKESHLKMTTNVSPAGARIGNATLVLQGDVVESEV